MLCCWITNRAQNVQLCISDSQMLCLKHANYPDHSQNKEKEIAQSDCTIFHSFSLPIQLSSSHANKLQAFLKSVDYLSNY